MSANERQVGGSHYKQASGVPQHWDLALLYHWDFFQYQITKYVMRWRGKGGIQDLKKAAHFLEKYIEAVEAGTIGWEPRELHAELSALLGCSSPDASIELGMVKDLLERDAGPQPTQYAGYTYEGAKEGMDLYRCKICRAHLSFPEGKPPVHSCGLEPAPGYVDQG